MAFIDGEIKKGVCVFRTPPFLFGCVHFELERGEQHCVWSGTARLLQLILNTPFLFSIGRLSIVPTEL